MVHRGGGQLGIALFEYLLQVPANRIGFQQAGFSLAQLKIIQEVITLACSCRLPLSIWASPEVGLPLGRAVSGWRCTSSFVAPDAQRLQGTPVKLAALSIFPAGLKGT